MICKELRSRITIFGTPIDLIAFKGLNASVEVEVVVAYAKPNRACEAVSHIRHAALLRNRVETAGY